MKLLVLSSFYPPAHFGGYELGAAEVLHHLEQRGYQLTVLTSTHGVGQRRTEGQVWRWLPTDLRYDYQTLVKSRWSLIGRELTTRRLFRQALEAIKPDLVFTWPMRHITLAPLLITIQHHIPLVGYISDSWLQQWRVIDRWQADPLGRVNRLIKQVIRRYVDLRDRVLPTTPQFTATMFCSQYLLQAAQAAAAPLGRAEVVPWGVDLQLFPTRPPPSQLRRWLFVGQLGPTKGTHTAIEALRLLHQAGLTEVQLTIAGPPTVPIYVDQLRQLAAPLGAAVQFVGKLPRQDLPALYRQHDALIFPSIWQEPFSISLLEALASGLPAVASATGGTPELIREGQTGLLFPADDPQACAAQMRRLIESPALAQRFALAGRHQIEQSYRIEQMVDRIEQVLQTV